MNATESIKQRVVYIDLLRVIATCAVIFLHGATSEFYAPVSSISWYVAAAEDSLVRWSVPVFVMISGALLLNPNKEVTYQDVLKRRIPRLLLAYVFWTFFYVMYNFVFWNWDAFSIRHLIRRSIVIPAEHLWFLPLLMCLYLLIPILRKITQDKGILRYALIIWIVYVFGSFLQFVDGFKIVTHFYSYFNRNSILGFTGYFLLGYYLSQHVFSKKQRIGVYIMGIGGALVTIIGTFYLFNSTGEANERYFDNLSLQVVAMATAIFVMAKELAPKCGALMLKFLAFVRKDLFGIYLIHALWLSVVDKPVFRHSCSEIVTLPLITIIVFVLSLFTTKLIRLIPYLRKVVE